MRGICTEKKYGLVPTGVLKYLIKKKDFKLFVSVVGNLVGVYDYLRESLLKKIYRSLPVGFKVWYDGARYRV